MSSVAPNLAEEGLISRRDTVKLCGISKATLAKLESEGRFPPGIKIRSWRYYSLAEVQQWIVARLNEGRKHSWQHHLDQQALRKAETEKALAEAALARAQIDALRTAPRTKRRCRCGVSIP